MKRYRLPRYVNLGYGAIIYVKTAPEAHLQTIMKVDHALDGCWDDTTSTIWIDESLSPRKRKQVYFHEIIHAVNDIAALGSDIHL